MTTRARLTLRKALALPPPYAVVFGVFVAFDVPREQGIKVGFVPATALALIIILSRSPRTTIKAVIDTLMGVCVGTLCFHPSSSPPSRETGAHLCVVFGPAIAFGLLVYRQPFLTRKSG